jgi:hypothetical protein
MWKMLVLLTPMVFVRERPCFFNLAKYTYLDKRELISTLRNLCCRRNCFQNLTQFSHWNLVVNAPASNTYGFLWRDTCVYSIQHNRPIWNKHSLSPPWKTLVAGSIPFKNSLGSHWEQCAKNSCFWHKWISFVGCMCLFISAQET